jgi:hypothetical protein
MTQKELDTLKIRVGAARGALTILISDLDIVLGPAQNDWRFKGITTLSKDAIKNLNLACDILESKT